MRQLFIVELQIPAVCIQAFNGDLDEVNELRLGEQTTTREAQQATFNHQESTERDGPQYLY